MQMANITFIINPPDAGSVYVGTEIVPIGVPVQFEIGSTIELNADPALGFEFLNWNEGESFDMNWSFEVVGDATISADFSSL